MPEKARLQDEQDYQTGMLTYKEQIAEWERLKDLAGRILGGEHKAYTKALVEFNPFAEISDLGSSINFTIHSAKLIECALKVNGKKIIPSEVKTLSASEKVSVKPMPKGLFHEIYLDYLCGCVLRVAREVFALLPVDTVLVTAAEDSLDARTGQTVEKPVLSVAMPRPDFARLNFDQLDPSDTMTIFQCRGDFKASRKTEEFQSIVPLTPADISSAPQNVGIHDLLASVRKMGEELKLEMSRLKQLTNLQAVQPNVQP